MTRTGRCACGAISWRTEADPLWSGHCHCESCRRASAAAIVSFFGVPCTSVEWSGNVATRTSSPGVMRGYCSECGTQVFYQNVIWPDETHLFAATLDDVSLFKPEAHYHYAERVSWLRVEDDLPKHLGSGDSPA